MAGYTLATLKQAIQDYTDNQETTFVSNLDSFIEAAEERILKEAPLEVFRKNATANASLGGQYLKKPGDWLFTYSLSYTDANGDKQFLLNKDVNFIQEFWPDATDTGAPRYYADFDVTNFLLAPTPSAAFEVELHYFYRPDSLITTSGATQTWLSKNAGPALLYGALVEAYTFMKGDGDMIAQYEQSFQRALSRINAFAQAAEGLDFYRRSKD